MISRPGAASINKCLISLVSLLVLSGCELFLVPSDGGEGRTRTETSREIFVLHSLAESISVLEIDDDGQPSASDANVLQTGAIPNDIVRLGPLLLFVVSGENAVVSAVEDTLNLRSRVDLGTNRNPMRISAFADATANQDARWLVAATNLLSDTVSIVNVDRGAVIAEFPVGPSPQAILLTPGTTSAEVRIIVSNTNFRTDRPPEIPYGPGSLTELRVVVENASTVSLLSTRQIDLEDTDYDEVSDAGVNPGDLVDLPAVDEVLVIGSGVNLAPGGGGADDGTVIVLDRETLAINRRIAIGGSPGRGVITADAPSTVLYTAGVDGVRRIERDAGAWATPSGTTLLVSSGATGSLFADCIVVDDVIYVADFSADRVLTIEASTGARLAETPVSDGPIALLWDIET